MNRLATLRLAALVLVIAPSLPAQQVCDGFNYQSNAATSYNVLPGTEIGILYLVPANAPFIIDEVQLRFPNTTSPTGPIGLTPPRGTIRIESSDPATGLPSGTVLVGGSFNGGTGGGVISVGAAWAGPNIAPTPLAAGQLIWVIYSTTPYNAAVNLGVENGGPDLVTSSVNTGTGWGSLTLAQQFKLRFRSSNCNPPGTSPTWLTVGAGCAGSNGTIPSLTPSAPPALGSTLNLDVANGMAGGVAHLYFSIGAAAGPITLPNGCPLWLEPTSFFTFVTAGVNPLFQVTINVAGGATFPVAVPFDTSLVGVGIGLQVALDDPVQGYSVTESELGLIGW